MLLVAEKDAFIAELKELIEKLEGQVHDHRRTKFGPKSEKLDPAKMELALEDLETAIAETPARIAAVEEKIEASSSYPEKAAPRKERKARALPDHLPRVERVIEPESIVCPCGCGNPRGDVEPVRQRSVRNCSSVRRLRSAPVASSLYVRIHASDAAGRVDFDDGKICRRILPIFRVWEASPFTSLVSMETRGQPNSSPAPIGCGSRSALLGSFATARVE